MADHLNPMQKMDILIIEDDATEGERLSRLLKENDYEIAGIATNYTAALRMFYEKKVDMVIIDIFLNGKPNGITFAETINITPNALKPFVFLTASKDRQIFESARQTYPFSFLLKPYNELEVLYAIEMSVEKFHNQKKIFSAEGPGTIEALDCFFIKKKNALKKIWISDILYIKVESRYCDIFTKNERFVIMISLFKINELLRQNKFLRTHRNFLVNAEKITEIIPEDNTIILEGNHHIVLSDKYKGIIDDFHVLK